VATEALQGPAHRLLTGATVWTGRPGDAGPRPGWGVALRGERILAVGPQDRLAALAGPATSHLDLGGRFLMPGFVDAHVHLQAGGLDLHRVDLRGVASPEEMVRRVAERARALPEGSWILGGGWDEHLWGGPLPHRSWFDAVAPTHPVFLLRTDLHVGVAGSRALELAGIGPGTLDPPMGSLGRDPDGTPDGLLRERALELLAARIPAPTPADREAALQAAALHALSRGVTQVHDMGALQSPEESWASLEALRRLHGEGRLPIRVRAAVPIPDRHRLHALVEEEGRGDARLGWGMVKGFVDGSLGAGTAWFHEPYTDAPGSCGGPITDPESLGAAILESAALGLQPVVHAIGDRAVDWLLSIYGQVPRGTVGPHLPLRVEHAQHVTPWALERVADPRIVLSVQPAHLSDDGPWAEARIGPRRLAGAYAFGSLLRAGARLAFGSDWTVAPLDPRFALAAAVTRGIRGAPPGSRFGRAEDCLSLEVALRAHTLGAAAAAGMEEETGTLEPGKRGDLVVLSRDPFEVSAQEIPAALRVEMTFVDGALAWQCDDFPGGGTP
jgi:predicted amidohydrolase YtcJ